MPAKYELYILTTPEQATRFREIKAHFRTAHDTLKAILDVYDRVGGTDIIKSQQAAEIGSFVTSDMVDNVYKKRGRPPIAP
jgi:DNA-binding ferritin-like protein